MLTRYWNTLPLFMNVLLISVAVLLFSWGAVGSVQAQTVYHVTENGSSSSSGTSWNTAVTFERALELADGDDAIVLAGGLYVPSGGNQSASFTVTGRHDGIKIHGGWQGNESFNSPNDVISTVITGYDWTSNPTVLSGDLDDSDVNKTPQGITPTAEDIRGDNTQTVLTLDGATEDFGRITRNTNIGGIVVTGGSAGGGLTFAGRAGAGIYCTGNDPSTSPPSRGFGCSPSLRNIVVVGNSARQGGAMYLSGENNTVFPSLRNVVFANNRAIDTERGIIDPGGGAIYVSGSTGRSGLFMENVLFTGNRSVQHGGAISNSLSLGGEYILSMRNVAFVNNRASSRGGAIHTSTIGGFGDVGTADQNIENTLFWGNTAGSGNQLYLEGGELSIGHTLLEGNLGGIVEREGADVTTSGPILDEDPQFVNINDLTGPDQIFATEFDGLRLGPDSPALNAGTNVTFTTDLLGEDRRQDGAVSIGPYERLSRATLMDIGASSTMINANETGEIEVSLVNNGNTPANPATVALSLPSEVTLEAASGDGSVSGTTWTVNIADGATASTTLTLTRDASSQGALAATATVNNISMVDGGVDLTPPEQKTTPAGVLEQSYGPGTALALSGSGERLVSRPDPTISENDPWTISFWARVDGSQSTSDGLWYLWKGPERQSSNKLIAIGIDNGNIRVAHWGNDQTYVNAEVDFDAWQHLAVSYDGTTERVYLNGTEVESRNVGTLDINEGAWNVAARPNESNSLAVDMEELRIWSEARTEADIRTLMHQTIDPDQPSLNTYYRFDAAQTDKRFDAGADATVAYDLAGTTPASFEDGPVWIDSEVPLGQESIILNAGETASLGNTGQQLEATAEGGRIALYRYGHFDADSFVDDTLPGSFRTRSEVVWGVVPVDESAQASLRLEYANIVNPDGLIETLLRRSTAVASWRDITTSATDESETFVLSGVNEQGEYGFKRAVPEVLHVKNDATGDATGVSFQHAVPELHNALPFSGRAEAVVVAAGTYTPVTPADPANVTDEERQTAFRITGTQSGAQIYGGWSGSVSFRDRDAVETALDNRDLVAHETILSGNIDDDASTNAENSYNVVVIQATSNSITANTVIDGFTIRDGNANDDQPEAGDLSDAGGGLHLASLTNDARPTLRNLRITQNAAINGGGVYIDSFLGTAAPLLSNVIVTENEAEEHGGGVYATASTGGIMSPVWVNAVFASNAANQRGGAFYKRAIAGGTVTSQVVNAHIVNNEAATDGGAAYHEGVNTSATMAPSYVNTLFWNNTTRPFGAELDAPGNGVPSFQHVLAEGGCPGGDATCDAVLDDDPDLVDIGSPGGQDGQVGTRDDGLRFAGNTPLSDAGTNTPFESGGVAEATTTDLLGDERIQRGAVNIGAYETTLHGGPIFYVKADATGAGDGSSFADAFTNPRQALQLARGGDVIVIAEGVYTPITPADPSTITESERATPFLIDADNEGVEVYGGWSGTQTFTDSDAVRNELESRDLPNARTVLSGDISGTSTTGNNGIIENPDDVADTNSHNVLLLDGRNAPDGITPATVVDGVVLTGGNLSGTGGDGTLRLGAGLSCNGGDNPCAPRLSNLLFIGNEASPQPGGGLGIASDADDTAPQAHLTDIVVTRNNSQLGGGGIAIFGSASPTITNAVFSANTGGFFGGGGAIIASDVGRSAPSFVNTTFTGNIAPNLGSAVLSLTDGDGEVDLTLINSVLWDNVGLDGSINQIRNQNNTTVRLQNTLMQEATGDGIVNEDGGTAMFLDADGDAVDFGQSTNLDADPLFADAATGDVRLTAGSPAIARGTFAPFESGGIAEDVTTDLAGNARLFGARPDLGAFTFNDIATTSSDIADAAGLLGYLAPTGFEGLVLLRENSAGSGGITLTRTGEAPTDPSGELPGNVAPFTWTVTSSLGTAPSYDLLLSTEDLGGISDFGALMLYKSGDGGQTWDAVDTFSGASLVLDEDRALVAVQDLVGFSQFAIASTDASNPLPVELAGFEAQRSGDDAITVQWETLSETGNAGFEVQRAAGSTWEPIATLDGAGTTDTPQSYRFEDRDLPYAADSLSYRLRQIDTGGTESFSEAVTIARQVTQAELLPTYPNPVRHQATVRFAVPNRQDVRIDLYDMLGRRIRTVVDTNAEGRTEAQLDVSGLASGTYFLRMQTESHTETQRITVVR